MPRSDEELTELESVIDADIRDATLNGFRCSIAEGNLLAGDCCPLAAVAKSRRQWRGWCAAWEVLGLAKREALAFVAGFDAWETDNDWSMGSPDLYAMGARFRERVIAGEYRHVG